MKSVRDRTAKQWNPHLDLHAPSNTARVLANIGLSAVSWAKWVGPSGGDGDTRIDLLAVRSESKAR